MIICQFPPIGINKVFCPSVRPSNNINNTERLIGLMFLLVSVRLCVVSIDTHINFCRFHNTCVCVGGARGGLGGGGGWYKYIIMFFLYQYLSFSRHILFIQHCLWIFSQYSL